LYVQSIIFFFVLLHYISVLFIISVLLIVLSGSRSNNRASL
jgi:hypothetical protein